MSRRKVTSIPEPTMAMFGFGCQAKPPGSPMDVRKNPPVLNGFSTVAGRPEVNAHRFAIRQTRHRGIESRLSAAVVRVVDGATALDAVSTVGNPHIERVRIKQQCINERHTSFQLK